MKIITALLIGFMTAAMGVAQKKSSPVVAAPTAELKEYKLAKEGFYYKFHKDVAGTAIQTGDYIQMSFSQKTLFDSTLFGFKDKEISIEPAYFEYGISRAITMMNVGDSATFAYHIDSLIAQQMIDSRMTTLLKGTKYLLYSFKISKHFTPQQFRLKKEAEEKKKKEEMKAVASKELNEYAQKNNLVTEAQASGLQIVRIKPGNGIPIKSGQKVKVHYAGYLIDGTPFDNSYDSNEPFEFTVGQHEVIEGWDEALQKMTVGEKVKLLIPSYLAYGEKGAGRGAIPPNAPLIFEVEVLEIK